jgi:hypothetical protein
MPQVNFNYFALHYLNLWLTKDRKWCEALEGNDEAAKLRALTEAATFYKVARNLRKVHDVGSGILRYKPVLDIIDVLDPITFQGVRLIPSIEAIRSRISKSYGNRGVTSLTTKISLAEPHALVIDEIGKDEDGKPIEIFFGALAMEQWGIRPIPDEERLDLTHYPDKFVEF